MTDIYVVLVNDRHVDPDVQLFTDKAAANEFAEAELADLARHPESIELYGDSDGDWSATWNEEGDYIRVFRRTLTGSAAPS
jgi:hypothetical protein